MNDDVTRTHAFLPRLVLIIVGRFSQCIRRMRVALNIDITYQYNNFSIKLPAEHLLPSYRKRHKLYDRFLPHLCRYLMPQSTVIDVGANCGDTLAAMCEANDDLAYVCIEPDPVFFGYLQKNVLRIEAIHKRLSVQVIRSLVAKSVNNVSLEGSGGTRRAVVADRRNSLSSRSLDDILSVCNGRKISLLKSDVDGFDYDVIDSAESMLSSNMPFIYFECQFDHAFQTSGYKQTIACLKEKGYVKWVIFDNFGEVVLRTNDILAIYDLIDYVWRLNVGHSTRTIFYYDILAYPMRDSILMQGVIDEYLQQDDL